MLKKIISEIFINNLKNCKFVKKHVMTTIQLKNALIQRISEIEDISFLEAIKTILEAKSKGTKSLNFTFTEIKAIPIP